MKQEVKTLIIDGDLEVQLKNLILQGYQIVSMVVTATDAWKNY
jgi:hypothetical protein